jgi:hypothetical protein
VAARVRELAALRGAHEPGGLGEEECCRHVHLYVESGTGGARGGEAKQIIAVWVPSYS